MNQVLHDNPVQLYLGNPAAVSVFTAKIQNFRKLPGGYTQWQDVIKTR
jgi:hypothetical protein